MDSHFNLHAHKKVPQSRTFLFTINLDPTNPTNVYYLIDYGDNSQINMPTYMPSPTAQISYTYQTSGLFSVNITTFNKVSSFTTILTVIITIYSHIISVLLITYLNLSITYTKVEIDSNFIGFNCLPYWRQYPTNMSPDMPYSATNGSYYVKQEYDVRFYCTWLRLG